MSKFPCIPIATLALRLHQIERDRPQASIGMLAIELPVRGLARSGIIISVQYRRRQSPDESESGREPEMLQVTDTAASKVKEIMAQQNPAPSALRVAVVGGGCSGFSYHMAFDSQENPSDNVYQFEGLKVFVDQMSEMYLDGVQIDYIETIEGAGFKFNNPNMKSTCGCGSSFSV